jgi:hypothetical protein
MGEIKVTKGGEGDGRQNWGKFNKHCQTYIALVFE